MTRAKTTLRSDQVRQPLVNTTAYWDDHATFIPKKGEIVVYSDGGSYEENGQDVPVPKIKIGDGVTSVWLLHFTDDDKKGAGEHEVVYAECTLVPDIGITCNMSTSEIVELVEAGKVVLIKYGHDIYHITSYNPSKDPNVWGLSCMNETVKWIFSERHAGHKLWRTEELSIPRVNDATLTIKKNGTTIDTFSANSDTDKTIDIKVPTNAADVSALPSSTKYAASLYLSVNSLTYVVTAQLKDQDGNNLGAAQTIDLPLESVVVDGSYNPQTKKVVLTLENGSTIEFSVADLVAGLQSEITSQNPLSADLVVDGNVNKVFTLTMKTKLDGIEEGAEVNVQSDWNQTDDTQDDYIKNKPTIPAALEDLNDIDIYLPDDYDVLVYSELHQCWENGALNSVAFTGNYEQLNNKPSLATVATSGDYDDLTNKPTIPTVPTHRTVNHEQITDSSLGDANLHDGFYFPNATQDYDGNWYGAVVIGDQVWLAENLRTTHYPDGEALSYRPTNTSTKGYFYPNDSADNVAQYGLLYNIPGALNGSESSDAIPSGIQGVSPNGWHIPSKGELNKLFTYIGNQTRFIYDNDSSKIAKSISSTFGWNSSKYGYVPGNVQINNNKTGLNLVPAGYFRGGSPSNLLPMFFGEQCHLVDTTYSSSLANEKYIRYNYATVNQINNSTSCGYSVRCVSDLTPIQFRNWYIKQYGSLQHHLPQEIPSQVNSDWNATTGAAQILNKPDLDATLYESVTYSQLVTKINNSQLVKGRKYRITDYVTTTTQTDTPSAGHAFDLVVTAIDVNKLDHRASALLHSGDTYFSTAGADLSKWQIWYDVNNDTTKYAWADTTNGKGVIYRMIDEWENDCPYDFKNILFIRKLEEHGVLDEENGTDTFVYTFNLQVNGIQTDGSLTKWRVFSNHMAENRFYAVKMDFDYVNDECLLLNNNVFLLNNYGEGEAAFSNKILDNSSCNTFMGYVCRNVLHGYNFWNTFGPEAQGNQVMSWVHDNDFGYEFNNNYIGGGCYCIKTDGRFANNHIDGGNRYIYFKKDENDYGILRNIYVTPNTYTANGSYTIIDSITTNRNYRTTIGRDSSGNIRIYNEDDPASASQAQADWNETDTTNPAYIKNKPTPPTHRTVNHEQITDSSLGDANLHDGFYFPNAAQDYDGNWYGAVVIGDKVWLGENLRTTHLADGTEINNGTQSGTNLNYHDYSTHPLSIDKRGLLYSYPVANSASGAIIANWKTPTSDEYSALKTYLSNQTRYPSVVKAMAATSGWASSETENAVGNNILHNNGSGLNLYPSGSYGASGETNSGNCILWATKPSNLKSCLYMTTDSTEYTTVGYNYSSWMLAIRLVSVFTPQQFRDWYVKTYGSLQHNIFNVQAGKDLKIIPNKLPYGYEELEYLESSGTQYINTGVHLGTNSTVFISATAQGKGDVGIVYSFDQDYAGSYLQDNGSIFRATGLGSNSSNSIVKTNVSSRWISTSSGFTSVHTIGEETSSEYSSTRTYGLNNYITLFRAAAWDAANSNWSGRIYRCSISKNNILVRNLIPAKRTSDNVLGLYDTVSGTLLTNAGSGKFIAGPVVAIGGKDTIAFTNESGYAILPSMSGNRGKVLAVNNDEKDVEWVTKVSQLNDLSDVVYDYEGKYIPNALTDYDGNSYGAVILGDQVWMAENLRTTHYADGTAVTYKDNASSQFTLKERGFFYLWSTVMRNASASTSNPSGRQGIAPTGWHIPSQAEFQQLTNYLSQNPRYWAGNVSTNIAKSLSSKYGWNESETVNAVGYNQQENNTSSFNAIPAGNNSGSPANEKNYAVFMTTTKNSSEQMVPFRISTNSVEPQYTGYAPSIWYLNVRCVYDGTPEQFIRMLMNKQVLVYDASKQMWVNKKVAETLPSMSGNSGKVMAVNDTETDVEWVRPVTVYSGSSEPSASLGEDGDIFILAS